MRCGGILLKLMRALQICKGKFEKFALLPNEELKDSFSRLNNIVNEL
jgi:hypothetical protein